ncbi:hypothetical protein [Kiloniella majae]|uniref:hypothetical protein n=1 Tax=Kiloniella majae TaxID=1938558 RepID=UPI000A2798A7|nr:hypothetical protein [Kiloniella majae]
MQFVPERISTYWLEDLLPEFSGRWNTIPGNIRGAILVLFATLSGSIMGALIKVARFLYLFPRSGFPALATSSVKCNAGYE